MTQICCLYASRSTSYRQSFPRRPSLLKDWQPTLEVCRKCPQVERSLSRTLVHLTDLRAPLDLRDRSRNRLLMVGIFPGRHQAEVVVVGVEVMVCTGLHRAAMLVGRVARPAIGPKIVRNVRLVIKQ